MEQRPGGTLARREFHLIWILDTSGSMNADGKIQSLNVAIHETIPLLRAAARANPNIEVLARAVAFSNGARWHVEKPTPIESFRWHDLTAGGYTCMGEALRLVAQALKSPPMPERAVSPMLLLVTDGHHTDDFEGGLAALTLEYWGHHATRRTIAIGRDVDRAALKKFQGDDEEPLEVNNAEGLIQAIRWTSRLAVDSKSHLVDSSQPLSASRSSTGNSTAEW